MTECLDRCDEMSYNGGMEITALLMAFRKQDLMRLARDLTVSSEVSQRDSKAQTVANLSEVLTVGDVIDWANVNGYRVTVS